MNEHETLLSDGDWTTSVPRPDNQTWQNSGNTNSIFPTQRIQSMLATIDEFAGESHTSEGQLSTEFARQSKLQQHRETNITHLVQTNQTLATQLEKLMLENKSLRNSLRGHTGTLPSRKSELLGESGFSFADELVAHGSGVLLKNPASEMHKPPRPQRNAPNDSYSEDRIVQHGDSSVKVKAFQDSDVNPPMPNKSNTSNATAEIRSVLELTESQHRVEQLESQNRMLKDSLEAMGKVQEENNELTGKVMNYQQKISKLVSEHQEELNKQQAKFNEAEQERIKTLNSLVQLLADHKAQQSLIQELKSKIVPSPMLQVEPLVCMIVEPTKLSNTYLRETAMNQAYDLHVASASDGFIQPRIHLLEGPQFRRTGDANPNLNPSNWQVREVERPAHFLKPDTSVGNEPHGVLKTSTLSRSSSKKRVSFSEQQQQTTMPQNTSGSVGQSDHSNQAEVPVAPEPRNLVFILPDGSRVSAEDYGQYKAKRVETIMKETQKVASRSAGILTSASVQHPQAMLDSVDYQSDQLVYEEKRVVRDKKKKREKRSDQVPVIPGNSMSATDQGTSTNLSGYRIPEGFTGTHYQLDERTRIHFPENYLQQSGQQQMYSSSTHQAPRSFIAEAPVEPKPPKAPIDPDEQLMREIVERGFNRLKQEQLSAVNEQKLKHAHNQGEPFHPSSALSDYRIPVPQSSTPQMYGAPSMSSTLSSFASSAQLGGVQPQLGHQQHQAQSTGSTGIDTLKLIRGYQNLTVTPTTHSLAFHGNSAALNKLYGL